MINILDLNLNELKQWMKSQGESEFRAKQVMDFIYKDVWNFDNMSNLPASTREKLKMYYYFGIPELVQSLSSKVDDTKKILLKFQDGNIVESVIMKYKHGYSICVSTQVGCRMGCKFCASTLNGMVRNLTNGEIIAQILVAQKVINNRISNVVLMGSGEPLDNFDNVIKFLDIVNSEYALNIGHRHITLSTCGIVPKIYELADLNLQITLAISLHAPVDSLRKNLMPIANRYSIEEVLTACKYYIDKTNKRITFEYALIKGLNDSADCAEKLCEILKKLLCHVNLIPVNQVVENNFRTASYEKVNNFANRLITFGINTTIRREMGSDINAACGQLRRNYVEANKI